MAKHGRGLICLTLTRERCQQLELPLMVTRNGTSVRNQLYRIDRGGRRGVDWHLGSRSGAYGSGGGGQACEAGRFGAAGHLSTEGWDGGVLVRAGHTERAVTLGALAGLTPASVICEIMNDDGTMARLPD